MKQIKRAAGVIAGILIFIIIVKKLNYMYMANDVQWERVSWHRFYENAGKIDNLYLGSSHVYCGLEPYKLNQLNGQCNVALTSSSQRMNGTYYLLKEADQYNDLSHVYVELCYFLITKNTFDADSDPVKGSARHNWRNTDYMRFSLNRMQYMITMGEPEDYPDIFLGFIRYREHLDDWDYVRATIAEKEGKEYKNYQYRIDTDEEDGEVVYQPEGYEHPSSTKVYPDSAKLYSQQKIVQKNPIGETSEAYLRKVIAYCQERDIPITLYIVPTYDLWLIATEHYDYYLDQVRTITDEYDVDFYDFNLAKETFLPIQQNRYFQDVEHMNYAGADLFTDSFYQVMSGDVAENQKLFYDTYEQKLAHAEPEVYGIYYRRADSKDEGEIRRRDMFIASNRDEGMEYRVIMTPGDEKSQYQIQDFSENKAFQVDYDEHGTCTIMYRIKDGHDAVQQIEITY